MVGLRSPSSVGNIVRRELEGGELRREVLSEQAWAVLIERHEALWRANWGPALAGDHKAANICLRLLDENARLHGLYP